MYTHDIEPLILLRPRLEEPDLAIAEVAEETFIADVAHTVEGELGTAFLQ